MKYNCTPNPFIDNDFKLIDTKSLKLKICSKSDIEIDSKECNKMCKKDCTEENYSLIIINRFNQLKSLKQNKAIFKIGSRNLPIFQYTFRAEQSFVIFISNIGGIMSLWFGLSFIDIHIIVRKMLVFIRIFFIEYLLFNHILETLRQTRIFKWFSKILEVLRECFDRLHIKNLKLLIKLLCIPCFFYQVIEITIG
jgi:hypothetical protein